MCFIFIGNSFILNLLWIYTFNPTIAIPLRLVHVYDPHVDTHTYMYPHIRMQETKNQIYRYVYSINLLYELLVEHRAHG